MDWGSLALGFPLGCLASLLAWWVIQHWFVPKIEFSSDISRMRYAGNRSGLNYRVKFRNRGRRDMIDVEVFAVVRNYGLSKGQPTMVEIANVPVDGQRIPVIKAGTNRIVSINTHFAEKFKKLTYGESVNTKLLDETLSLEDVLSVGDRATLTINIFGYDSWSGSRKMFESKPFSVSDIKDGAWVEMEIPINP